MDNRSYHFGHAAVIIHIYQINASTVRERIGVYIGHENIKRNHLLIDQILNLVLKVYAILVIMSNAIGVICTLLIRFVKLGASIH